MVIHLALALPPGIAVAYLSDRYLESAKGVKAKSFYFDLAMTLEKAKDGYTQTTPSAPHFFALQKQLHDIQAEGLKSRMNRHTAMLHQTQAWAARHALSYFTKHPAPTVSCILFAKSPALVSSLREKGFTIGGGYGELKDSTFRIAHMGDVGLSDLKILLDKMSEIIEDGKQL
jgi:aspartate aminotransferase-like enzyme